MLRKYALQSGKRKLKLVSGENDLDPSLRGSNQEGARFGWTIVGAGDLNNDGYQGEMQNKLN